MRVWQSLQHVSALTVPLLGLFFPREPVYGYTPLMEAAASGHEIIVQYLLNHVSVHRQLSAAEDLPPALSSNNRAESRLRLCLRALTRTLLPAGSALFSHWPCSSRSEVWLPTFPLQLRGVPACDSKVVVGNL